MKEDLTDLNIKLDNVTKEKSLEGSLIERVVKLEIIADTTKEDIKKLREKYLTDILIYRLKDLKSSEDKRSSSSDIEYSEQLKLLKTIIDKTKKEIMTDVFNAQKDIDTLKSIKLNSVDFYEFRNVMQGMINKVDALFYVPEAVKLLGNQMHCNI